MAKLKPPGNTEPASDDGEEAIVRSVQQELRDSILKGHLENDALRHPLFAISRTLDVMMAMHRASRRLMIETLEKASWLRDPTQPLPYQIRLELCGQLERVTAAQWRSCAIIAGCLFAACTVLGALVLSAWFRPEGDILAIAVRSAAHGDIAHWLNFMQQNDWGSMTYACSKPPAAYLTTDGRHACALNVYLDTGPSQLNPIGAPTAKP